MAPVLAHVGFSLLEQHFAPMSMSIEHSSKPNTNSLSLFFPIYTQLLLNGTPPRTLTLLLLPRLSGLSLRGKKEEQEEKVATA